MPKRIRTHGFTLLEILISLFILSIIGVIITAGLNLTVKTQGSVERKYKALTEAQLALTIIERDLQQIIDRPILDEKGEIQAAFQISENRIQFTRSGFINPFFTNKRSTLQRVAYHLKGSELIRSTWPVLDRETDSIAMNQLLLTQVKDFYIQLITPPPSPGQRNYSTTTKGILIEINVSDLGYIKRVIAIPTNTFEISYAIS